MDVKWGGIYLYEPLHTFCKPTNNLVCHIRIRTGGSVDPYIIVSRDAVNKNKPTAVGVPLLLRKWTRQTRTGLQSLPASDCSLMLDAMHFKIA